MQGWERRLTPCLSEDPNPQYQSIQGKKIKGKKVEDTKGREQLGQ